MNANASWRFEARPMPAKPSSIIAQVESSGTGEPVTGPVDGGGGGSRITGSERSRVTTPFAPKRPRPPVRPLKATSPKETPPVLKPAHVPDCGAANHNASVSPALLEAPTNPTDGTRDRDALWLNTERP